MDIDAILDNGGYDIKNPNYNPKTKKGRAQPPYLKTSDMQQVHPFVTQGFAANKEGFMFNVDDYRKYIDAGINLNNWESTEQWDKTLADSQSNWSKATNAIGQTLVSEIGLGTLRGASDLIDRIGQAVGLSDHDYSNPVSQYLEQKQKEFEEWAPVYVDPQGNTLASQFNGNFNLGYWFSNMPSIASSLTLLIPSTGITKALSWAGKASKISKFTNRAARVVANPIAHALGARGFTSAEMGVAFETGINAALSRTMENYQEARQTYNDSYADMSKSLNDMSDEQYNEFLQRNAKYLEDENVDVNNRDEVAKSIARTAADRTFQLDFANVVFDAYQIYGLRNLLTHAPKFNKSAKVRATQRESLRTAGMTEEQAAAELAKDDALTKASHWFSDRFLGAGRQIKSELSEGIEEAVNYIAQQEGTHLGKYLLTGEDGDSRDLGLISSLGPMSCRLLNDYVNDSGIWDSAFWGVVGGVVFQAGGSRLNRLSQTIKNRQDEKKSANKDNETTKEAKVTPHWWMLDQSAETERMVADINGRNVKLQSLRENMQKINAGKNPYIKNEDGSNPDTTSPVEERMLREKAYTEYLDELILSARNNGTLDMLSAYLENSNVQKAIVGAYQTGDDAHKISQQEAEQAARTASERIKKIDRMYQDEIIHASDIADRVGDKEGTSLPAEYIQMIASSNVRHRLNLERYDEVAAMYNEDTERIINTLGDKFERSIDYKGLVSLRATIQELSSLVAEKKYLEKLQRQKPTLTRQFDIDEINNQISLIKRKALQTSTDAQFARTIYTLQVADSAIREYAPDGKNFKVNASDVDLIANMDKLLTEDLSYIFREVKQEKRTNVNPEAVVGELKKVMNDMRYVLPVDSTNKPVDTESYLASFDPKLPDNYDMLARIELEKIKEAAKLAETEKEVRHYIGAINNIENVARKKALEEAFDTIATIQKNHTDVNLMKVANTVYGQNSADWLIDTNGLSDEERTDLDNALKILNLSDVKNKELWSTLAETLMYASATQKQVDANNKQNTEHSNPGTQNSSTSQNSNGEQQNGGLNNQSGQPANQARTQGNGQIDETQNQNAPTQITLSYNGNTITSNVPANDEQNTKAIVPVKDLGNGNYELDFVSKGTDVNAIDISNNKLFDVQQQPMDGAVVKRNPIVRFGKNNEIEVIAQGLVENPSISSTGEQEGSSADNTDEGETSDETTVDTSGPEAPVRGADPAEYIPQIAGIARNTAMRIKDGETITYEDYLASLADIKTAINDDTVFERIAKEHWNRQIKRLVKKYPEAVDNLLNIMQSSTTEESPDSRLGYRFKTSFKKEVEKLVKAYLKDIGQKKVNGKYVISLENLLRYCNGEFQNNENAELLYNVLANYLTSEEASDVYQVVESKNEIAANDFLDKVKTPLEERIDKATREENHRINTIEVSDNQVFDEIEEGQELTISQTKDRIYFSFDGKQVGYIGKPRVVGDTYSSPYKYFLFRIRPNGKDTYYSKLADVFKSILRANSGELEEIKNAALVGGVSLKDNKTWQAIKAEHGINTIDSETGEEYDNVDDTMLQVIRTMANFSVRYGSAEKAVDGWFNNLAQEYIAADYLAKNKDAKVTVDAITDGWLIRNTNKLTDNNGVLIASEVDKLPVASKAIGRNYKGRVSVAIGSRKEAGTLETVVKKENGKVFIPASNSLPGVGYANTFVVFPLANGKTAYAQAFPVFAKSLTSGSPAAAIATAFRKRIDYYLEQIANSPTDEHLFMELQNFLFEALNYKGTTTPLFHMDNCEKVNKNSFDPNQRGTHIGTNGRNGRPRRDLHIFYNKNGNPTISIDRTDSTKKKDIPLNRTNLRLISDEIRKFLSDTLQFNISAEYIASDNNSRHQVEGLATRDKDGKFVVRIGDETFKFDSYNDFILENDLVRLNTKPNEHGNNVTRTSSNPNIRYKIVTSSPVERITSQPEVVMDVKWRVNQIMSSDSSDKAAQLASLVFGKETVDILNKYDLLPHNLVFDVNFNIGEGRAHLNASFNRNTKVTTIGTKFIAMLSNPNEAYRKQAIRKLIHERLHDILHSNGNEHYVNDIKSIYDTFVSYLDDEAFAKPILEKYLKKINSNKSIDEYYDNFKKYKYLSKENEEVRLEEFLVDTLTSVELADFLNNITGLSKVNMRERKRDTLLNKIMRVLAKIMGINIKNDSLYAQEFETLRNVMNTTAESNEQFDNQNISDEEQQEIVEETTEPETTQDESSVYNFDEEDDDEFASSTSEEVAEYNQELEDIKSKAIADGTFMKAPNGNPTNLNERQWLQVRTKNFINWFGDWINDPANASKVVDENGEPLVVYHGSQEKFSTFSLNTNNRGSLTSTLKKGFYFSNKNIASQYASSKTRQDYYKLEELREGGFSFEEIAEAFGANRYDDESMDRVANYLISLENEAVKFNDNLYAVFLNIREPAEFDLKGNIISTLLKEQKETINSSEGAILKNVDETTARYRGEITTPGMYVGTDYIVFNSNQIKSATNNTGAFSSDNDDIRYSSTSEEYENVASIADYILSYSPEDRAEVAKEINTGELSIKCK